MFFNLGYVYNIHIIYKIYTFNINIDVTKKKINVVRPFQLTVHLKFDSNVIYTLYRGVLQVHFTF